MADRTIHATLPNGQMVVRYNRAGKWYSEFPADRRIPRRSLTIAAAVNLAAYDGADVHFGRLGGKTFDARVRARIAALHGTQGKDQR